MVSTEEKNLLRELAKAYAEIAAQEVQQERMNRMRDTNDLKIVRPPVLVDEIPWHEMASESELALCSSDPFAREMETYFRRHIFRWKHFPCDTVAENFYPIRKAFSSSGFGLSVNDTQIATDINNNIVSHAYNDQLADEAALEKVHPSEITVYPEDDAEKLAQAEDILNGILPVRLCGAEIHHAPWDWIPCYHGVENCLIDMVDRPDFLHKMIAKFTEEGKNLYTQFEKLGLLDPYLPTIHCTPAYISGTPAADYPGGNYRVKDVWFRSMAQMFTSISPDMLWEFDLQYSMPLMEQCAYTYYGCCEVLDNKINLLKKIPNLRKIGVSPWANVEKCAEQIGPDYVLARKPNPANVASNADAEVIRKEITETVEASLKYGCPCEFVLKDISTISFNSQNLIIWAKTVSETLDQYY